MMFFEMKKKKRKVERKRRGEPEKREKKIKRERNIFRKNLYTFLKTNSRRTRFYFSSVHTT